MKYDRLTRELFFEVDGKEYSIRPTNGVLARIESMCPKGETLISMTLEKKAPTMPVMVEAFCAGLKHEGKSVPRSEAEVLCNKYIEEYGVITGIMNVYYALMAVSNFLGKEASDNILANMGIENIDTGTVVKKNNHQVVRK